MDEHLQRHVRRQCHPFHLVGRQFAGQNDTLDAKPLYERDAARLGQRHLRRGMQRQSGGHAVDQTGQPQILHDDGVGAGCGNGADEADGLGQLVGEDKGVEGDVAAHVALVEVAHHRGQLFEAEVGGAVAGIEGR